MNQPSTSNPLFCIWAVIGVACAASSGCGSPDQSEAPEASVRDALIDGPATALVIPERESGVALDAAADPAWLGEERQTSDDSASASVPQVYSVAALIPENLTLEQSYHLRTELAEALQSSIGDYLDWIDGATTVSFVGDRMILKTTAANHADVSKVLKDLEGLGVYKLSPEPAYEVE